MWLTRYGRHVITTHLLAPHLSSILIVDKTARSEHNYSWHKLDELWEKGTLEISSVHLLELLGREREGGCTVHLVLNIHNCCGWGWDHKGSGRVCRGTQLQKFAAEPACNIAEWLVSHWFFAAEGRVQSHGSAFGVCGRQMALKWGFLQVFRISPAIHSIDVSYSSIIIIVASREWHCRPIWALCARGFCLARLSLSSYYWPLRISEQR